MRKVKYISPFKRALVDKERTLRLGWWQGNNALKGRKCTAVMNRSGSRNNQAPAMVEGLLDIRRGTIIEGRIFFQDVSKITFPGIGIETEEGTCVAIHILSFSETMGGLTDRDGIGFTDRVKE